MCVHQVMLLSATMPVEVLEVTKKFMRDPIQILVKKEELTLEGIRQFYINVEREVRERGKRDDEQSRQGDVMQRHGDQMRTVTW